MLLKPFVQAQILLSHHGVEAKSFDQDLKCNYWLSDASFSYTISAATSLDNRNINK